MMRKTIPTPIRPAVLAALLLLAGAATAWAQPGRGGLPGKTPLPSIQSGGSLTYQFEGTYGGDDGAPVARVVFTQQEAEELCLNLATRRGPKEIKQGLFIFFRVTEVDGETDRRRLDFDFPKDPEMTDENQRVYKACLDEAPVDGATKDELEVMVRRPRKHHVQVPLTYPPTGYLSAIQLFSTSDGQLTAQGWIPPDAKPAEG